MFFSAHQHDRLQFRGASGDINPYVHWLGTSLNPVTNSGKLLEASAFFVRDPFNVTFMDSPWVFGGCFWQTPHTLMNFRIKQMVFYIGKSIGTHSFCATVHAGRLTWNLQIAHLERKMIFQTSMIMFHVNLQGCNSPWGCLEKLVFNFWFASGRTQNSLSNFFWWVELGTLDNTKVVASKPFYFHPYLGKWSDLTNIFQMGWNHQLDIHDCLWVQ